MGSKRGARRRMMDVLMIAGVAIGMALGTGACSVSFWAEPPAGNARTVPNPPLKAVETATMSGEEVARAVSERLTQMVGRSPDSVTCPEDLPARVGATIRCQLRDGSKTYGVTVTTTQVNGTQVRFDLEVDKAPTTQL